MEKEFKKLRNQLAISYPWSRFIQLLVSLTYKLGLKRTHRIMIDYGMEILDWRYDKFKRIIEIQNT